MHVLFHNVYPSLIMIFPLLCERLNNLLLLILFYNLFPIIDLLLILPVCSFSILISIPNSFKEVVSVPAWQMAMDEEIRTLVLVELRIWLVLYMELLLVVIECTLLTTSQMAQWTGLKLALLQMVFS